MEEWERQRERGGLTDEGKRVESCGNCTWVVGYQKEIHGLQQESVKWYLLNFNF